MKKLLPIIIGLLVGNMLQAQVSLTINETTAGTLSTLLTKNQKDSVTHLTITGTINACDFVAMWKIQKLSILDLSGATIVEFKDTNHMGPVSYSYGPDTIYPANTIPISAFSISTGFPSDEWS